MFLNGKWIKTVLESEQIDLQGKKSTAEETNRVRGLKVVFQQMWIK